MNMAINPGLGNRSRIGPNKAGIAVRQIQRKEMRLLLNSADHNQGLAKIGLGMAGGMGQRDKHLATASSMFPDIVLDRRLTAAKLVLIPQALKNALGGVALFARKAEIVLKPLVDEAGEPVQLGALDRSRSLISGWDRKAHHLVHARTRNPKVARCRSLAHAATPREADLQV